MVVEGAPVRRVVVWSVCGVVVGPATDIVVVGPITGVVVVPVI